MEIYRKIIAVMILLLSVTGMAAQSKFNITGTIIEKGTSEPVISATVRVLSLPDSTMVTGAATDIKGNFSIKNVKKGKYALKVTYIGFVEHVIALDLTNKKTKDVNVGYITMHDDQKLLKEAVVTANAAQVQVSGDSLMYNASAIRTAEGSALEELVKKLPGAEVDDDGNITINGKTVKKILVDGKEFFLNDTKIAMKNLPTKIIDKIKSYDRKSDLARVTGIDDGEEETVLDLTIKKGMNQGWFGNFDAAYGTQKRYTEKFMMNRFSDTYQLTLLGSANNTGDRGFGGGGGRGGWGRGGNGLRASKDAGFNFATTSAKLETGGNIRFHYDGNDIVSSSNTQNFVTRTGAFSRSSSTNKSSNISANLDLRFEWKPDSMTNIIFRPSAGLSRNRGYSSNQSGTFNGNPDQYSADPLNDIDGIIARVDSFVVNTNNSRSQSYSLNRNVNGELQLNRKLNNEGRNITFRATGGYGASENRQISASQVKYYLTSGRDVINNRYYNTPAKNANYSLQATYSEPIAERTYLQFSYRFNYSYSENDRQAFTYDAAAYQNLYDALLTNRYNTQAIIDYMKVAAEKDSAYIANVDKNLSKFTQYHNYNHTASVSFRKVTDKYNLSAGLDFLPQNSRLQYQYMGMDTIVKRAVFNFAPNADFRYNFNKQTQLRFTYRGRTAQPSMTDMLPINDDSDPLNIRQGNPGLKPSFTHNINGNFNTYNADLQQGIFAFAWAGVTQNSISNRTYYDERTGVRTTMPENINGNWNANLGFGYNRGIDKNKYFTVNTFTRLGYNHQVSYLDPTRYEEERSKTNALNVNERLSFGFRKNWFEVSINGNLGYRHSRNSVVTTSNLDTWDFSYGMEMNLNFDLGISFNTDLSQSSRRGYSQQSMNTNELLWNAKVSYSFLKGRSLTISAEWNDILQQRSNISRMISAMQSSDTEYNAIYSYGMIHIIYKLNIFGGKAAYGPPSGAPGIQGGEGRPGRPGGSGRPGGGRPM